MAYWAKPKISRTQVFLFSPTLDESISEDHPVRLYWEILNGLDWSDWEARYNGQRGQPPIHPQVRAGAILYGLNKGIRSSRQLEDACLNRLDFVWLAESRQIDHSTFAAFRTNFQPELKKLFVQIGRVALAAAHSVDAARKKEGNKNPAQIPLTDPDARVIPGKQGVYEPSYTPRATTDGENGLIVDAEVINDNAEAAVQTEAVDRIKANFGKRPETAMGDGASGASQNVGTLDGWGVELLTPLESKEPGEGKPAKRDDLTQPVPEAEWEKLPIRPQTKHLDHSAFVYDKEADCYWCPQGRRLDYRNTKQTARATGKLTSRVYQCEDCAACPLSSRCKTEKTNARTVQRDENEEALQRTVMRMATDEAQERYRRRSWIAETPFAIIKAALGIRRFLLRGMEKVNLEWDWICSAFNLGKLVRLLAGARTASSAMSA